MSHRRGSVRSTRKSLIANLTFLFCREIRECLKLDPEHKTCFPHYKKVKKIEKLMSDAEDAINSKDYKTCIDKAKKVGIFEWKSELNVKYQS